MYGPKYVWLILGWFPKQFWRTPYAKVDCQPDDLEEAIDGTLTFMPLTFNPIQEVGIAGMTSNEFAERMLSILGDPDMQGLPENPTVYDGIWTIALALNKTASDLRESGKHVSIANSRSTPQKAFCTTTLFFFCLRYQSTLRFTTHAIENYNHMKDISLQFKWGDFSGSTRNIEDFHYGDSEMAALLLKNALSTDFQGIKGPIHFDDHGDSESAIDIGQIQSRVHFIHHYIVAP